MEIVKTKMDGVLLIKPDMVEDFRGGRTEIYNKALLAEHGVDVDFVTDDWAFTSKHVLRGIHGDDRTWKLMACFYGRNYLVVVNCDETSKNFGQWEAFILSDTNRWAVVVPPKYGDINMALSDRTVIYYKQSTYYNANPKGQFTYKWDDPRFKIWLPVKNPILSRRDEEGHYA